MNKLSIDDILKIDLKTEMVEVPEWGGSVTIKELNAKEVEDFGITVNKSPGDALGLMCQLSIVNDDGTKMFHKNKIDQLIGKSHSALLKIFNASMVLSGLSDKAAEDIEKN